MSHAMLIHQLEGLRKVNSWGEKWYLKFVVNILPSPMVLKVGRNTLEAAAWQ